MPRLDCPSVSAETRNRLFAGVGHGGHIAIALLSSDPGRWISDAVVIWGLRLGHMVRGQGIGLVSALGK